LSQLIDFCFGSLMICRKNFIRNPRTMSCFVY